MTHLEVQLYVVLASDLDKDNADINPRSTTFCSLANYLTKAMLTLNIEVQLSVVWQIIWTKARLMTHLDVQLYVVLANDQDKGKGYADDNHKIAAFYSFGT